LQYLYHFISVSSRTGPFIGREFRWQVVPPTGATFRKARLCEGRVGTHSFNAPVSTAPSLAGTPLAGVTGFPVSITENEHIVKAGVNYRFW
jgi:hypothetical protein